MAINTLSLPVDIPWKRLCFSEDMIDREVCDREFPYRWRSSVAVFSYEPPEEHQEYEGMIVSYLKVACTITGFQPDPEEVGIRDRRVDSYWNDPLVIENYKDVVSKYYGCYGAILEVAIAPSGSREEIPLSQYPFFVDFEPKKRELYELVSETGEVMSRSLENVNVRKGTTTSQSHEVLDIFGGFSQQFQYAGTGGGHSIQGQWGTRDVSQEEYSNIRTTDQAREMRETFSHTTQLTQMYHQFTSYHLGTNRAVFFMLPRPHIVQVEETFVNGPRLLEGIQEVFLVVMRPKEIEDICVEAYLETAHIISEPIYEHDTSTGTLTLHVEAPCRDTSGSFGDDSNVTPAADCETYNPPDGWEVDTDRDGGFVLNPASGSRIRAYSVTEVTRDHVTVCGMVDTWFEDRTWPQDNVCHYGRLDGEVTVYIRKKTPKVIGYNQNLWLTGRGVCCGCPVLFPGFKIPGWVVWEWPLDVTSEIPVGGGLNMTIQEANQLRTNIGRLMVQSVNHPDRYPFGTVRFADTQFVARRIAGLVRTDAHPDNNPVTDIKGLDSTILDKVVQVAPKVSRGRLLQMSLAEQVDRFGLSYDDAVKLRRAATGLEGPAPEPQKRWDRPGQVLRTTTPTEQTVPNVVNMPLEEAREVLQAAYLFVGDIANSDSEQPSGTILNQYPTAGETASVGSDVDLVVATGATVPIPNVIGSSLSQALIMLREAGLESEPEILFAPSGEQPKNHVLDVTPEWRTYVTPHSSVVLQVSSGVNS